LRILNRFFARLRPCDDSVLCRDFRGQVLERPGIRAQRRQTEHEPMLAIG